MHRMHRIFPGYGQLLTLSTRKPAPDRCPSRHLVHRPFVLLILCILCIHVQKISVPCAVAGPSGWRRWPRLCQDLCGRDARAPGWASSHDLVTPRPRSSPESDSHAAAFRPDYPVHPAHPCSKNIDPWRRSRSIRVEAMGQAMPRPVRAGRPRSRVGLPPMTWRHQGHDHRPSQPRCSNLPS